MVTFIVNFMLQVDSAIADMGLRHIRNSRIGGTIIKGISGGEKRRVSVAIQLLQDPGKQMNCLSNLIICIFVANSYLI